MATVRGRYRDKRIDLDAALDLPDGEQVYVTVSREQPTETMTPEQVHEIIMSFDSLYPDDEWATVDPKAWGKLWMRTPAEAAAEILRRRAAQREMATGQSSG